MPCAMSDLTTASPPLISGMRLFAVPMRARPVAIAPGAECDSTRRSPSNPAGCGTAAAAAGRARHAHGDEIDLVLLERGNALGIDDGDLLQADAEAARHLRREVDV